MIFFKTTFRIIVYANIIAILAYSYMILSFSYSFSIHNERQKISKISDKLLFAIVNKYSSEDVIYNDISIYNSSWQKEEISKFSHTQNGKWMLRIPKYSCNACIDRILLSFKDYLKDNENIIILANADDKIPANIFIKKYRLEKTRTFFTNEVLSNISLEEETQPYFQKISMHLKTDNIVLVNELFDIIANKFFKDINNEHQNK
jgi:hypothetical protein